jgi:hypothetical protein
MWFALVGVLLSLWLSLAGAPVLPAPHGAHEFQIEATRHGPISQEPPPPQNSADQTHSALVALALGVAILCSSAALGIAYGIRRRIDMLAGPPDDDDD